MSGKKHTRIRACLIGSERSGSGRMDLGAVLATLGAQGWDVTVREKRQKGDAVDLARDAADAGYDPIVSCGGDGTLNEIVTALAGTNVAVASIPGGTENVWARQVGISQRAHVAAMQLVASRRVRVDVGRVSAGGHPAHSFLMMAGIGADGAVMQRVSRSLKERIGPLAVGVAGLQALPDIRPVGCEILMDGLRWHGDLTQVVVGNTRQYGGFTQTTPNAYADDGLLDVCIFTASDFREAGRQALSLILRRRPAATSAEIYRAPYVLIRAQSTLPLQVDGSPVHVHADAREYTFSVVPDALSVLVPRTYGGEIFRRSLHKAGKKHR